MSSLNVAEGYYIPTLPANPNPRRFRLKITEATTITTNNYAFVIVRVFGADNCRWQQTQSMRIVGEWESVAPMSISNTGAGPCFFDMQGTLMLLDKPFYTYPDPSGPEVWQVEDVMGLGGVSRIMTFAVGDSGNGTQFANPCSGSSCQRGSYTSGPIHPGRCRWECVREPTPMGP